MKLKNMEEGVNRGREKFPGAGITMLQVGEDENLWSLIQA